MNRFIYQSSVAVIPCRPRSLWLELRSYDYKEAPPPPPQSWCVTPPDTEFRIGIPGWLSGVQGDFGVAGLVTDQDVDFTDILNRIDMLISGSLYARYHRWEIFADGQYLKVSDSEPLRGFLLKAPTSLLSQPSPKAFSVIV